MASRRCALLADEMRLGKTAQAITGCQKVGARRVLVVCPAIARTHWRSDWARWWPEFDGELEVASYDAVRINPQRFKKHWCVCILDECHYLKNPLAARTRAVLGSKGVVRLCRYIWALSGTPAPNGAHELWALLKTFGATKYLYDDFVRHFCHVDPISERVLGTKKATRPELKAMVQGKMLRRTKRMVAPELPPCTITPHYIEADYSVLHLARPVNTGYWEDKEEQLEWELREQLEGKSSNEILEFIDEHAAELATLRRLHSVLKVPALIESLRFELENEFTAKVVVFGYHRDALHIPHELLKKDFRVDILYGGTAPHKRDRILERFRRPADDGGTQVLFASITAAGTAIDLSAAHDGVLLERDWVPANNAQALERMGGYKQTKPITIRDFTIPGSCDEIIGRVLDRKMKDLSSIFGDD